MQPAPEIEVIAPAPAGAHIAHALFDFDGTISLLRQGWQTVMAPLMVEVLAACPASEPRPEIERVVAEYIAASTGIQTIYQMIWLADAVEARGGRALTPEEYKERYLARLKAHIADRIAAVRSGSAPPEQYLVPGVHTALTALRAAGVACYLASGTDVEDVRAEATLLGVDGYFCAIHGALADWRSYSKARVIADILATHQVPPTALLTFGDGYVEIENTHAVGGVAVGVASDEEHPGALDAAKRQRLIAAGANYILSDLRPVPVLLRLLGLGDSA
ncbi:MAG: HAD family hydrolase [Anaerolineales bacterium]